MKKITLVQPVTFSYVVALMALILGLFAALTLPAQAVTPGCETVVAIDNNTNEWAPYAPLASDGADVAENYLYYNSTAGTWSPAGTGWQLGDDWRTDLDRMMDIEEVKTCNNAVELFFLYDSYFPLLGLEEVDRFNGVASGTFIEFGDVSSSNAPSSPIPSPADWNKWIVFELNSAADPETKYWYTIEFDMSQGEVGVDPTDTTDPNAVDDIKTKFWSDNPALGDQGAFNPFVDTLEVTFDPSSSTSVISALNKAYTNGALEGDLDLLNAAGEDIFTVTGWAYGDAIEVSMSTYDDSAFNIFAPAGFSGMATAAVATDATSSSTIRIKKVGPQTFSVAKKYKKKPKVALEVGDVKGSKYKWQLQSKKKHVIRKQSTVKPKKTFKKLVRGRTYKARVKVKVGDTWTPFSKRITFRLKR